MLVLEDVVDEPPQSLWRWQVRGEGSADEVSEPADSEFLAVDAGLDDPVAVEQETVARL